MFVELKKRAGLLTHWRDVIATVALMSAASATFAVPSVYPTGTTRYDPAKAYNSYLLFSAGDNVARLIDLNGNSVHEWKDAGAFSTLIDPALADNQRGHVLLTLSTREGRGTDLVPGQVSARISETIGEVDWNGHPVWQFGAKAPGGLARQHHDWVRLANGNTVVLANLLHPVKGFRLPRLLDDVIYEVSPAGEIVWRWVASEHLLEFGFSTDQLKRVRSTGNADYLHLNNLKVLGPNRWFAAGDARFAPDNLLIDSRNANFIAIIDRRSGKVVWSLGPQHPIETEFRPERRVPRPFDRTSGQHDAHLIPEGLPGAGNLLVFDNEGEAGYPPLPLSVTGGSRVLEIDPVRKEIVWQYTGEDSGAPSWTFHSTHISNARRLPNGNTLINEGQKGRFFQVTRDGDIVWEYVNPYQRIGKDPFTGKPTASNQVYRVQPVPYDWVPECTPRSERPVTPPAITDFHVPG
ncbi:MAG: ArsR family transcriptional regulator [Xanthomonadaceae bacterium]|nr:ArsR family transcriptional regulator [Xanthomonadaceae bacterium]